MPLPDQQVDVSGGCGLGSRVCAASPLSHCEMRDMLKGRTILTENFVRLMHAV